MPLYSFQNPETNEVREFLMGMNEIHEYFGEETDADFGTPWNRVWHKPNAAVSSVDAIDPFSQSAFREKTANMKGSYGDVLDYSKELSEKRASKAGGEDPVKRKVFDEYKKKTGKRHLHDYKKTHSNRGVKIEL